MKKRPDRFVVGVFYQKSFVRGNDIHKSDRPAYVLPLTIRAAKEISAEFNEIVYELVPVRKKRRTKR